MSENNKILNNDIDSGNKTASDEELEELISTVMAIKKGKRKTAVEKSEDKDPEEKYDVSFKKPRRAALR